MTTSIVRIVSAVVLPFLLASHTGGMGPAPASDPGRRMSFHNRLLLNRAVLSGLSSLEVLLIVSESKEPNGDEPTAGVAALVRKLGGRVNRTEGALGYLRVEVPTERLLELTGSPAIEAYQISSLSRGAWYRDGPPVANAEMFRGFEVTPVAATEPPNSHSGLPALTPAEARASGFTADDDVGVGEWMKKHPTFDGRGVTIALVESGLPAFSDPTLRTAKTLDGKDVPKVAGIVNAIGPDSPDETRVRLDQVIQAAKSWTRIGDRTYILPHAGRYRAGMFEMAAGGNVIHRFAVVEDPATREVWMDANGDASFQDEPPLADVNVRFEPRVLKLAHPRKADVSFVMGRGAEPHVVHIYPGRASHQAMTVSVAAGSRTDDSLAHGVAPHARVLLVRKTWGGGLGPMLEGYIVAAQQKEADVITASAGLSIVPDTAADFVGLLFRRLHAVYRKPIINAGGNFGLLLAHVHSDGDSLSAGGTMGPATFAALYGGRALDALMVHPMSAIGPALDGAIKPDFLAPMERLAADLPWNSGIEAAPQNTPTRRIAPGYQVSCCTSASSPYAAGVAALLISAAKQSRVPYSGDSLSRALRFSARLVPGFQAHEQGNGALDVEAAWRHLSAGVEPPRIVATADIVHPLAQYAARGSEGLGIFEFEGWAAGMTKTREIRLRRDTGPAHPVTYRLAWSGDDGTFTTASSVTLPLGLTVRVPVKIAVRSPGAHSGLLTLRDATNQVVFRTQATVVASERVDPATYAVRLKGTLGLLGQAAHYLHVPAGAGAIDFEFRVLRGVIMPTIMQSHGLVSTYYMHVHPKELYSLGNGTYRVVMPNPEPGTWTLRLAALSTYFGSADVPGPRDDGDAEYMLAMRVLGVSIHAAATRNGAVAVDLGNTGARIDEPVLEAWAGSSRTHRGTFLRTGLPNVIEIAVPSGTAALSLQLRSETQGTNTELHLYDCTTGECFSYDIGFPAASSQRLLVRKPAPGRWVAAVNAAPYPAAAASFVLDEVITTGAPVRRASSGAREPGARWREVLEGLPAPPPVEGRTPVLFLELLDAAVERREQEQPWSTGPRFVRLRDRPVALGTAIYRR